MLFILLSINNKHIDCLLLLTVSNNIYLVSRSRTQFSSCVKRFSSKINLTVFAWVLTGQLMGSEWQNVRQSFHLRSIC